MTQTNDRLDRWCEDDLGQQRDDCAGCMTMSERLEGVKSPGAYVDNCISHGHFSLALCLLDCPTMLLWIITWSGVGCQYMMQLGSSVKRVQLLKIKEQVHGI